MQLPNAPLLAAASGWLVAAVAQSPLHDPARAVFLVGLSAWAWQELAGGANWFRRALGAGALTYAAVEVAAALAGRG